LSPGTDQAALQWARDAKVECYGVVTTKQEVPAGRPPKDVHILAIGESTEGDSPHARWVEAADDYKLLKADCLVAVWDGGPARGEAGGSVRLIAEALRRQIPIVWIAPLSPSASSVRLSQIAMGPAAALVDPLRPETMRRLFEPPLALADLAQALTARRAQEKQAVDADPLMRLLTQFELDPGDSRPLTGFWHSQFFALVVMGGPYRRKRAGQRRRNPWARRRGGATAAQDPAAGKTRDNELSFAQMDRAASYTASLYRDRVVLTHLLSSFAVLGAVAGAINWLQLGDFFWGMWELGALVTVGLILRRDRRTGVPSRDAWLLSRQTAELLRLSGLLYPYLASLAPLHRRPFLAGAPDNEAGLDAEDQEAAALEPSRTTGSVPRLFLRSAARWWVGQRLREAKPPSAASGPDYCLSDAVASLHDALKTFLAEQKAYHTSAAQKYELTHHRLHRATQSVYFVALAVVLLHLLRFVILGMGPATTGLVLTDFAHWVADQDWLLLLTAFFPALAAALHGIMSTLEFQRLAQNSTRTAHQLGGILDDLDRADLDPIALRARAVWAIETLFHEHDRWAELMSVQNLGIPA
ncbi:MAG: hypothetical protein M0Z85_01055, partial [Gammaproteobacteria bacterium]|nr:hypothetical protein [Gammaproteobacteria bacterium]